MAGNYAYVADGGTWNLGGGLHIINVIDPAAPVKAGFYEMPGGVWGVAAAGDCAYVADSTGLHVIDITDPAAPTETGFYDMPGGATAVVVVGDYAYVASGGLKIIDVSDPTTPTETR